VSFSTLDVDRACSMHQYEVAKRNSWSVQLTALVLYVYAVNIDSIVTRSSAEAEMSIAAPSRVYHVNLSSLDPKHPAVYSGTCSSVGVPARPLHRWGTSSPGR